MKPKNTLDHRARRLLLAWTLGVSPQANPEALRRALELARAYALAPRAASALLATLEGDDPFADEVRELATQTLVVQRLALVELADLVTLLGTAGVRTLVLKGGAMLAQGYVAPGDRHMDDIDVLVDPARADDVDALLDDAGWHRIDWASQPGIDGRPLAEHNRADHHALIPRVGPAGSLFDLHRALPDTDALSDAGFDALWARAAVADVHGVDVRCMAGADLVSTICHHVVVHHRAEPRYLGRHIADLVAIERALGAAALDAPTSAPVPDAPAARALSRALLKAARDELDTGTRSPLSFLVLPVGAAATASAQLWHGVALAERLAGDARHRPAVLGRKLVPTREYVAAEFGIEPTSPILPLCYVARLVTVPLGPLFARRR